MSEPFLLVGVIAILFPVLLTFIYSKWMSPLRYHENFSTVSKTYKRTIWASAILPLIGILIYWPIAVFVKRIDVNEIFIVIYFFILLLITFAASIIVFDVVLRSAKKNIFITLLLIPHLSLAMISTTMLLGLLVLSPK